MMVRMLTAGPGTCEISWLQLRYFDHVHKGVLGQVIGIYSSIYSGCRMRDREIVFRKARQRWHDGVHEEIKKAGGISEDTEVVVDGNLVTSRWPMDLPAFMREMMKMVKQVEKNLLIT